MWLLEMVRTVIDAVASDDRSWLPTVIGLLVMAVIAAVVTAMLNG